VYTAPLWILAHTVVIAAMVIIPLMATDALPEVRSMLAFVAAAPPPPSPPPPAKPRTPRRHPACSARPDLAPIETPTEIAPESGVEATFDMSGATGELPCPWLDRRHRDEARCPRVAARAGAGTRARSPRSHFRQTQSGATRPWRLRLARQLAFQPSLGKAPIPRDGDRRHSEQLGDLVYRQTAEVPQFDDPGFSRVDGR
jgi:hypothetical protein